MILTITFNSDDIAALKTACDDAEKAIVGFALTCYAGNKSKTAAALGVTRKTLLSKIRKYHINEEIKK